MNRKNRFFAKLVDYFFISAIMIGIALVLSLFGIASTGIFGGILIFGIAIIVYILYFGLLGLKYKGSLGKKLLNLEVRRKDGKPLTFVSVLFREPLIQVNLINSIIISIGFGSFLFVGPLVGFIIVFVTVFIAFIVEAIYAILFLSKNDFWNRKYIIAPPVYPGDEESVN